MTVKIVETPIESHDLYNQVLKDSQGAIVTFVGVVRDNTGGKRTDYLIYEAYKEMAENEMAKIVDEIKKKWDIEDVAILHRIGKLNIGEISVLIAVGSPHRSEAFDGCRYAIDRLKEKVPIWKKEIGEDGETWIEGPK
jgi:molybdopterin synthase catalytic subunit